MAVNNRQSMTKEMETQVRAVVKDEARAIVDENVRLKLLINRLLGDLPSRRDWLDPDLEREMREAVGSTEALERAASSQPLSQFEAIRAAVAARNKGYRDRKNGHLLNAACADEVAAIIGMSDWRTP